ncbi:hypothetical protein SISNIDRAFT_454840 [Sistotremastrum niveocremeum HHB9708]|uniref:FYR N-terminal domain-containing protein n=2 Tax=Sistotremastraceae TaxID=3402574 RepID=A0A164U4C2_9AGAM|nr:hypothetical protein SISNIDRAFT_454840 [Sistotremastrum niveocremeum HHB9708]KZT44424.1 hypothetical protein SISSUDRAFT_1038938 [Sistotremastrum suecicum HHB10207 ss-3]
MASFSVPTLPPPPIQHRHQAMASASPDNHNHSHHHHEQQAQQQIPQQQLSSHAIASQPKTLPELEAKYGRLKRKYFEMEGRVKDEKREKEEVVLLNLRLKEERRSLLSRIEELERGSDHRFGNAYPNAYKPPEVALHNLAHLRQTLDSDDRDEAPDEPRKMSRHIGALSKKSRSTDDVEKSEPDHGALTVQASNAASSSTTTSAKKKSTRSSSKKTETFVQSAEPPQQPAATIVSSGGTRLRIKPPAPPQESQSQTRSHRQPSPQSAPSQGPLQPSGPQHLQAQSSPNQSHSQSPSQPQKQHPTKVESAPGDGISPISPLHSPPPGSSSQTIILAPGQLQPTAAQVRGPNPRASSLQRATKPKRLKPHTVTAKTFSVPMIPRDPRTSNPILPLNVGIMTVISLGEVCMREHFHTERYIFPVGYEVTRRYLSAVNANSDTTYNCKILEGPAGPVFQIIAHDMPAPIEAGTATGAWSGIVRAANLLRNRQHSNSVSGPDYFGLGQNTIKHLIQGLPNADKLRDYVWQNYLEGGPMGGRHAAVMPALPDDPNDHVYRPPAHEPMEVDHDKDHDHHVNEHKDSTPPEASTLEASSRNSSEHSLKHLVTTNSADDVHSTTSDTPPRPRSRQQPIKDEKNIPSNHKVPSSMASILNAYPEPEADVSMSSPVRSPRPAHSPLLSKTASSHGSPQITHGGDSPSTVGERSSLRSTDEPHLTKLPVIPRDGNGHPILPLEVSLVTVLSLGEICTRADYHNRRCIYPIGYEINRRWMSAIDPDADVIYNCKIMEGPEDQGPLFQVTALDQPKDQVLSNTSSGAWEGFLERAKAIRHQFPIAGDNGDEYFGLTNPTIRHMLQELPGAKELAYYEWKSYVEAGRSAKK